MLAFLSLLLLPLPALAARAEVYVSDRDGNIRSSLQITEDLYFYVDYRELLQDVYGTLILNLELTPPDSNVKIPASVRDNSIFDKLNNRDENNRILFSPDNWDILKRPGVWHWSAEIGTERLRGSFVVLEEKRAQTSPARRQFFEKKPSLPWRLL